MSESWRYARKEKKKYLLVYSAFACTNIINATRPWLYGWFINALQKDGLNVLHNAWIYAGVYLGLNLLEWMIHGPARIAERTLAFNLSQNYLMETYHQTLHLPVKWHQDNHSGAIINRVRKAYEALKHFFQDGFMFFHSFAKFIFSFAAMLYFSPLFGAIGAVLGALTIWLIFQFDKPLIKHLNETNEKEHVVSANLFDSLSNINTVITLRLEKQMEKSLLQKVRDVFPPFRKNVVVNEWKWFVADMLVALVYAVITIGYVIQNRLPGQVFLVGGLVTLLAYVNSLLRCSTTSHGNTIRSSSTTMTWKPRGRSKKPMQNIIGPTSIQIFQTVGARSGSGNSITLITRRTQMVMRTVYMRYTCILTRANE